MNQWSSGAFPIFSFNFLISKIYLSFMPGNLLNGANQKFMLWFTSQLSSCRLFKNTFWFLSKGKYAEWGSPGTKNTKPTFNKLTILLLNFTTQGKRSSSFHIKQWCQWNWEHSRYFYSGIVQGCLTIIVTFYCLVLWYPKLTFFTIIFFPLSGLSSIRFRED